MSDQKELDEKIYRRAVLDHKVTRFLDRLITGTIVVSIIVFGSIITCGAVAEIIAEVEKE